MYVFVYYILFVCVCVCVCARVSLYMCLCVCAYVCMHTICSHCESYNIDSMIFYIMKSKIYFEVIFSSFDKEKFNIDSEQFEFGAHAARCTLAYIVCEPPSPSRLFCTLSKSSIYVGLNAWTLCINRSRY